MNQGELTRNRILKSAGNLFYAKGFHQTAFSDIVEATGLSKGNITYHFKYKEDILNGVFRQRLEKTQWYLTQIEQKFPNALTRINAFIDSLINAKAELTRYGCQNGSIAYELGKSNDHTRDFSRKIFNILRNWFNKQFQDLGFSKREAEDKGIEFLTRAQGIILFSQVYNDETLLVTQVNKLKALME